MKMQIRPQYKKGLLFWGAAACYGFAYLMMANAAEAVTGCAAAASLQNTGDSLKAECEPGHVDGDPWTLPNCQDNTSMTQGPLTKCVLEGEDPPAALKVESGVGQGYGGTSSAVLTGGCTFSPSGNWVCSTYENPSFTSATIPTFDQNQPPTGSTPQGVNLTAPITIGSTLPALSCGGALPLNASSGLTLGGIHITPSSTSGNPMGTSESPANNPVTTINNIFANLGACAGSVLELPQNVLSLVVPPILGDTALSGGNITPPAQSFINIPAGMDIQLDKTTPSSFILPNGGQLILSSSQNPGSAIDIPPGIGITIGLQGGPLAVGSTQIQATIGNDPPINIGFSTDPGTVIKLTTTAIQPASGTPLTASSISLPVQVGGNVITPVTSPNTSGGASIIAF